MKTTAALIIMCTLCVHTMYLAKSLLHAEDEAFKFERAYENARSEVEALYRTKGFHVNSAYVCKRKPAEIIIAEEK
jgi:hypothetical protein